MEDERRHNDYSENLLPLDEAAAPQQTKTLHGESHRGPRDIHLAQQSDAKRGPTRHEPLHHRAQEQPPQHKPMVHKHHGALDPAEIQPHAPHGHDEFLPAVHAGTKGGTKATSSWWQPIDVISQNLGLQAPVVTSPPETAALPKPKPLPSFLPAAPTANVIPETHQRQHGTATKPHPLPRDNDVLEVRPLEHHPIHHALGNPHLEEPKEPHRHFHHGHLTAEGNAHGGHEWVAHQGHQASHAHPPQQLHPTASSGRHHATAEGLQLQHHLPAPLATARHGEDQRDYMHRHMHSAGPMDAWADTDLIPPHAVDADAARRLSDAPPRVLIDHYLGKKSGASSRGPLRTTIVAFLRCLESACLVFITISVVLLCLAVFYTIGEYPIETSRVYSVKTDPFNMPTVVLSETINTADVTDSLLERKLVAERSTTVFHPERARNVTSQKRPVPQSRVGRRLQAVPEESADDDEAEVSPEVEGNKDLEKGGDDLTRGAENNFPEPEYKDTERGKPEHGEYGFAYEGEEPKKQKTQRRGTSISRRVCSLEVAVDYTFFQKIFDWEKSLPIARQKIVDFIATIVNKVNAIYGTTSFGGIEDIHFVIQHIVRSTAATQINEPSDCVGSKRSKNPFCSQALDAAYALYLVSLVSRDEYCLSYRINYRDFMDGTLGLAWIASNDGSGGLCERYRASVEKDPASDSYKQAKLSLNTGVTTVFNYNQYVGMHVAALTFAHEIGHSFGSPHDSGATCDPYGPEGKYLMYESATVGTAPNNDRFSPCSIRNISSILVPFLAGKTDRENCFLRSSQCKVACDFPEMKDHCGAKLPPGSPCNAMRGYCDVFSICRDVNPRPFLTSPSGFFIGGEPFTILYEFIA
ncbi:hypothetical protein V5799_008510, partial [Amblyomma americanum]